MKKNMFLKSGALISGILCLMVLVCHSYYISHTFDYCQSPTCHRTAKDLQSTMNMSVDPCDDFYTFTCGNFGQNIEGYTDWYSMALDIVLKNISNYLESDISQDDPVFVNHAKFLYKQCMNTLDREDEDFGSIAKVLKDVGLPVLPPIHEASPEFSLAVTMARSKWIYNKDFFVSFGLDTDPGDSKRYRLSLSKPDLGQPLALEKISMKSTYQGKYLTSTFLDKIAGSYFPAHFDVLSKEMESKFMDELTAFCLYASNISQIAYNFSGRTWDPEWECSNIKFRKVFDDLMQADMLIDRFAQVHFSLDSASKYPFFVTIDTLQTWSDKLWRKDSSTFKMDWEKYLRTMFEDLPDVKLDFENPSAEGEILLSDSHYLAAIMSWLAQKVTPQQIEMYMWWKTVNDLAPYTSTKIRVYQQEFLKNEKNIQPKSSNNECADRVNSVFPLAVSYHLMNNTDVIHAIKQVSRMFEDIRSSFQQRVENVPWMDKRTKTWVLGKLKKIKNCFGFPNTFKKPQDLDSHYEIFSEVKFHKNSFLKNLLRLAQLTRQNEKLWLRMVAQDEAEEYECSFKPMEVNAWNFRELNMIGIAIGYLQYPFYGYDIPALSYGTIGNAIGHEMGHSLDSSGIEYDEKGDMNLQWTDNPKTRTEFEDRIQCFIDHYDSFPENERNSSIQAPEAEVYIGVPIEKYKNLTWAKYLGLSNGRRTIDENIADSSGLKAAFHAFQNYSSKHGPGPFLPGFERFTSEQLFFLAFAREECISYHVKYADSTDEHSPHHIRVWGSLTNSEEFSRVWGCKKGTRMNPTKNKCELW